MPPKLKDFLLRWLVNTLAVAVAVSILGDSRIHYRHWDDLLMAALLLGVFNAFLRPLLMLLTLPVLIFTLGLFTLVINAALLWLVGQLLQPDFQVANFKAAFWGAFIISFVSLVLNSLTGTGNSRIRVHRGPPSGQNPPDDKSDDDDGPVIDV